MELFMIFLAAILSGNYVLMKFLGICPFLGVSQQVETATGMGVAVTFVVTLAGIATWLLQKLLLDPFGLQYLQTILFILIIAGLVQFVEIVLKKVSPTLYRALGVYLPLITTNCVILGVAILNITSNYNLLETIVNSLGAALGFTLALVLFAGIRERLAQVDIPEALQGFPIALITAGLLSFAFMGFLNLVKI